ncbi:hypothetical protein [Pseudoneobacillus sp. C159]
MKNFIKVPLFKYLSMLGVVGAHVAIIGLLAHLYVPRLQVKTIVFIGVAYIIFKIINYLVSTVEVKDTSIVINGLIKRGVAVPFRQIEVIEIIGPSQFNSNYMVAFFGETDKAFDKKQELGRFPIYWYSRREITALLEKMRMQNPQIAYEKRLIEYLRKENWKYLLVNYLIQYAFLGVLVFIIIHKFK